MGIDGISLMLIMLTVFLMPICIGARWVSIDKRVGEYMAAFLLMEVLMIGVFTAQDIFLFYIFFEAGLIPMYLIIGVWGGANRVSARYKFFLYTLLGSVLMLIAMLWMAREAGTTSIPVLLEFDFLAEAQTWLWLAFFASFAVKMPMRSEEHTSELQPLMHISYAVFCFKKKQINDHTTQKHTSTDTK